MVKYRLSLVYFYGLLVLGWLVIASPLWTYHPATSLRGDWVDAAISDVLSEKYGSQVTVRNAYFSRWCELTFGAFAIDSKEGKPLVRASGGRLRLCKLDLSAKGSSETEIRFEDILFTKDYYGSSRAAGNWRFLLRKPIRIEELCFLVKQDRTKTKVAVTGCRSEGVRIAGDIEMGRSGVLSDNLEVSVSPWTALRSIV